MEKEVKSGQQSGCPVIIPCESKEKELIVCDMCGHANPKHTALCVMCSNYLKGMTKR